MSEFPRITLQEFNTAADQAWSEIEHLGEEPPFFEAVNDEGEWGLYIVTGGRNGAYQRLATFDAYESMDLFFRHMTSTSGWMGFLRSLSATEARVFLTLREAKHERPPAFEH